MIIICQLICFLRIIKLGQLPVLNMLKICGMLKTWQNKYY